MSAEEVLETEIADVIVATGAQWRRDGVGRALWRPIPGHDSAPVFTPDDVMAGRVPAGRVVIYDDDHYYMGGVLAELLAGQGCEVTLVTPAPSISYWSQHTMEQDRILERLTTLGVGLHTQHTVKTMRPDDITLSNMVAGNTLDLPCDGVVLIADRLPDDTLYRELKPALAEKRLSTLRVVGDAEAPGIIAQAVYSGYLAAREFDEDAPEGIPFQVEYVEL
jgi:dimethylamine/trimethylamine dehydrogenase